MCLVLKGTSGIKPYQSKISSRSSGLPQCRGKKNKNKNTTVLFSWFTLHIHSHTNYLRVCWWTYITTYMHLYAVAVFFFFVFFFTPVNPKICIQLYNEWFIHYNPTVRILFFFVTHLCEYIHQLTFISPFHVLDTSHFLVNFAHSVVLLLKCNLYGLN